MTHFTPVWSGANFARDGYPSWRNLWHCRKLSWRWYFRRDWEVEMTVLALGPFRLYWITE